MIVGVVVCAAGGDGQSPQPVFRSDVNVVRVDVSVVDGAMPVRGLTAANFTIFDNGVRQRIDGVFVDSVPLDITLLLDTSASVEGERLTHLVEAARGVVERLESRDRVALMTFSEGVRVAAGMSHERQPMMQALGSLSAGGYTSLNDAVFLALLMEQPEPTRRSVLLVFSDGDDTSSWLSSGQVLGSLRRSGTIVHCVELIQEHRVGARGGTIRVPSPFLHELALAGGGRQWSATSSGDLRRLFSDVLTELRSRYLLAFSPRGVSREGWHDLEISLKDARGTVVARPGYFGSSLR